MSKTRSGYFFLSFALLIVAVLTPVVLVTGLNDISVKTSINLYKNRVNSLNTGGTLATEKFSDFIARFENDIYGRSEIQAEANNQDGPSLKYAFFAKASLVPSLKNEINGVQPVARPVNSELFDIGRFKIFNNQIIDVNQRFALELNEDVNNFRDANYFYSLPALGTGNATDLECEPFSVVRDLNGADPIDHPCNFNKISVGDSIVIPLYVKQDNNVDLFDFDKKMIVRFKAPCTGFVAECDEQNRIGINEGFFVDFALFDKENAKVWRGGQEKIRSDNLYLDIRFANRTFTELGLVVNGDQIISDLGALSRPVLIVKIKNEAIFDEDNIELPYLEYQVIANHQFGDNKLTMTSSVINEDREYRMQALEYKPEVNVDLGVVFGN